MRRFILSAGLSLGLALSPVAASAVAAATPAAAAAPSPHALDLAKRYIKAMRMEEAMAAVFAQFDPTSGLSKEEAASVDAAAMREAMIESTNIIMPRFTEALIPHVAAAFTEQELEAMVAFYESPVGQSVVSKSQVLAKPSMDIMQGLAPQLTTEMMTRYCAKTDCTGSKKGPAKKQPS